jgi:hypothetical protein
MDIAAAESELDDILALVADSPDNFPSPGNEEGALSPESAEEQRLVDLSYLEPMRQHLLVGDPLTIIWRPSVFFDGDHPAEPMPAVLELIGRARILCYGPYLPLPVGKWTAKATLGFSQDINGMPFLVEFVTTDVTRGFFIVQNSGIYSVELTFRVEHSLTPVEVRLISQESALNGQVALIEVEFSYSEGPALT